jgi:hypothetical protein
VLFREQPFGVLDHNPSLKKPYSKQTRTTQAMEDLSLSNDVQTIREILFGQQSKNFQQQIQSLEEAIAALHQENQLLRDALQAERQARETEHRAGIETLQQNLENKLNEESKARSGSDQDLQRSLSELIENLRCQHAQQTSEQAAVLGELVTSLSAYRERIAGK